MRKRTATVSVLVVLIAVLALGTALASPPGKPVFTARLSGSEMVAPVDTNARGHVIFHLSKDGSELRYKLIVSNIENVTQANIYLGRPGLDGPALVTLYPERGVPQFLIPGRFNGVFARGVITQADLGGGLQMEGLIRDMRGGFTHVKVRTSQYPFGEIRGRIK